MPNSADLKAEPRHMARALQLAARGRSSTHPNPRVGCVIVRDGQVVGEGFHCRAGGPHAEVLALKDAGEAAKGADVYVTLEPCSHTGRTGPCVKALIDAKVGRVIAAMRDPNPKVAGQGLEQLRAAGIPVVVGLMQTAARRLNQGFVHRHETGRPLVRLKLAASLDGRTAMATGESQWITAEPARADVHRLRADTGAILTGSATVRADNPAMTVRLALPDDHPEDHWRQPTRVVIDSRLLSPTKAKIWLPGARRIVLTAVTDPIKREALERQGVEVMVLPPAADGSVPLDKALQTLAACDINELLLECGPRLAGAFLQAQLVDELVLYQAPMLMGDAARPLASLPGIERLKDSLRLEWLSVRSVGPDLRIVARPVYGAS